MPPHLGTEGFAISHDTWIHELARACVRPLVDTPVTPNHLTTLRLAVGLGAAGAFAVGETAWTYAGAAAFLVSMLLDRADGELARASGKTSAWGHTYDLVSDGLCNAAAFIGVGIGLRDSVLGAWAIPCGTLAGLAIAAILWLVIRIEEAEGQRAAELGSLAGFDPDDAMLIVPVAMILGGGVPLIAAAAIGAPGFALWMTWRLLRRSEPARPRGH